MMDLGPNAYVYRPLRLAEPPQEGWDVLALQSALQVFDERVRIDGTLGKQTSDAIVAFQGRVKLSPKDGIAGIATQKALALRCGARVKKEYDLPEGMPKGHIEKESGYQLGNFTEPYSDGSRDCGVVQRNTRYALIDSAFNVVESLDKLARQLSERHLRYREEGVADARAWALAAGSWNRPSHANWLAGIRDTSAYEPNWEQIAWLDAYMEAVMKFTNLNP